MELSSAHRYGTTDNMTKQTHVGLASTCSISINVQNKIPRYVVRWSPTVQSHVSDISWCITIIIQITARLHGDGHVTADASTNKTNQSYGLCLSITRSALNSYEETTTTTTNPKMSKTTLHQVAAVTYRITTPCQAVLRACCVNEQPACDMDIQARRGEEMW